MKRFRSTRIVLNFAPSFLSGVASVLTPTKKNSRLQKAILSIKQNDGAYEDWQAIGNDLRIAMNDFNSELTWQRK